MFDIGFTELLLVGIVALLVVGPEKLPSVIRTGLQYFRQFKSREEVSKAIGYDELKDSVDELKEEAGSIDDFSNWDDYEVDDDTVEADINELQKQHGPVLPDPEAHSDTGVEADRHHASQKADRQPSSQKAAQTAKDADKPQKSQQD